MGAKPERIGTMAREILNIRKYKAGYEIRTERLTGDDAMGGKDFEMKSAYTPDGDYIGNGKTAYFLCKKKGIKPEKRLSTSNVCSIGFSKDEQKWYGWSHRAIFGYGIGDTLEEGSSATTSGWTDEYLEQHPEEDISLPVGFTAKTLDEAKKMAMAFAESVS
jgi:hypothetical protein